MTSLVMKNFNVYINESEKVGGATHNWSSINSFKSCANDCSLIDLPFNGPRDNWLRGNLKERIDHDTSNVAFQTTFSKAIYLY